MSDIEELMRRAIEAGQFDNLPGKGKPLNLEDDVWIDADWRLAHHILKSAGYTLPWIETLKEIDASVEEARQELRRACQYHDECLAEGASASQAGAERLRAEQAFREKVLKLNQRIRDYNLQAPSEKFQRRLLDPDIEIKKTKASE